MSSGNSTFPTDAPVDPGMAWFGLDRYKWAWIVGGIFAFSSVIWGMIGVYSHYQYNKHVRLRKWCILVLLMVPIYSLTAWFGLYMKEWTVYWDCAREVYEAVCIYAFFRMLVCYLDGEQHIVDIVASKEQQPHLTPFNWIFKTWTMGPVFYLHVRFGVLQYVYLRSITAIITFMTNLPSVGVYHDGNWKLTGVYPYVTIVNNFSQIMAMYCLVLFFMATEADLSPIRPLWKFACVKLVVFMTFWQAMGLSLLEHYGIVHATQTYTADDASKGLQDFMICIEMFIAAGMHWYIFPATEFAEVSEQQAAADEKRNGSSNGLLSDMVLQQRNTSFDQMEHDSTAFRVLPSDGEELLPPLSSASHQ